MHRLWILSFLLPAVLITLLSVPDRAHACSLAAVQVTEEWIRDQVAAADLIVVGEAGAEWSVDTGQRGPADRTAANGPGTERAAPPGMGGPPYFSSILVAATLKGQAPATMVDVGPHGYLGADCSGGPRLELGERVLLLLRRDPSPPPSAHPSIETWSLSVALAGTGTFALRDGAAWYETYGRAEPAGPAEDLIALVGDAAGSDPGQVDVATRYARGEDVAMPRIIPLEAGGLMPEPDPAPTDGAGERAAAGETETAGSADSGGRSLWTAALGGAAALLTVGAVLGVGRRRRRRGS